MVVEDTGEFQEGQRVRVRQDRDPATRPDRRLGKWGSSGTARGVITAVALFSTTWSSMGERWNLSAQIGWSQPE